jgi:radical SAM-linked protein
LRQTLVAKFDVTGSLRFVSHQEMLRVWQRALIRAGLPVCFSEGFNPHPRISLPLPRSVGIEAKDEIACVCIEHGENESLDAGTLQTLISGQLPVGCTLMKVEVQSGKADYQATGATYFLPVRLCAKVQAAADNLMSRLKVSEPITVERRVDEYGNSRTVDVCEYIGTISIKDNGVSVECRISPAGSIRVHEIMKLLQIEPSMLTSPVRRISVQWLEKN